METAEEKIERLKREREEAHAAAIRNRVYIPKYHFPTQAAVYKVENCINKSHQRRVRSKGLQDIIDDDNRISQQKMRDIKKIAQNIDKVATIEANLETQTIDPNLLLSPYSHTSQYEIKKERVPIVNKASFWVTQKLKMRELDSIDADTVEQTASRSHISTSNHQSQKMS